MYDVKSQYVVHLTSARSRQCVLLEPGSALVSHRCIQADRSSGKCASFRTDASCLKPNTFLSEDISVRTAIIMIIFSGNRIIPRGEVLISALLMPTLLAASAPCFLNLWLTSPLAEYPSSLPQGTPAV